MVTTAFNQTRQPHLPRSLKSIRYWEGKRSQKLLNTPVNEGWNDADYMRVCQTLAHKAHQQGEVPVGAVVIHRHPISKEVRIIGRGYNLRENLHDPTAHAEIVAIRQASQIIEHWRLDECELYVTLEPCAMCAGAIVNSRIQRVIYGCDDPKAGATRSLYQLIDDPRLNHRAQITRGLHADSCAQLLRTFFKERRRLKQSHQDL